MTYLVQKGKKIEADLYDLMEKESQDTLSKNVGHWRSYLCGNLMTVKKCHILYKGCQNSTGYKRSQREALVHTDRCHISIS